METTGNRIAFLRKQKGLTQEALAEQAGINLRTLQRIEKGETEPRGATLRLLCDVLEVPIEDLVDFGKTEDRGFIICFHLSVLSGFFIPIGQILIPFILWITKRDKIKDLYRQGANVINFQLWATAVTYILPVIYLTYYMSTGFSINPKYISVSLILWGCIHLLFCGVWPVINALRIYNGAELKPFYPWLIRIIK